MSEHFHFTAAQANMKRALALAKDFVSQKSMLPVLHSVVLTGKAGDSFLTLTATNLESVLRVRVAANVLNSGSMSATYTVLRDLVNTLPGDEPIEFKVEDDLRVEIVSGGRAMETNLILFDPDEYPLIPEVPYDGENTTSCTLNGQVIQRVAAEVAPLSASDTTRPTLTGVSMRFSGGNLEAAATDGFRLARLILPNPCSIDEAIIVPAISFSPLTKLVKLVADSQDLDPEFLPVQMVIEKKTGRVFWSVDDGYIATMLINGNYPDFHPIIPKTAVTRATVGSKDVHERVQVVGVIASESDSSSIFIEAAASDGKEAFRMSATSVAVGDADGDMPAVVEGPDIKMAVAAKYLTKSLAIFKGDDDVIFSMLSPMDPLMLTWRKDDALLHLIMPMHQSR